jgi:sigma-B regulation protein RsbU (phosphoserine phosphatase)
VPGPARGWVPLAPLAPLATVVALDLAGGRSFIVLGLTVISPLFAASLAGPAVTALYGALALAAAAGLGVWDGLYAGDAGGGAAAQAVRLGGVLVGGLLAVWASARRVERERRLTAVQQVAEVAQRTILPATPFQVPGLVIASAYRSAAIDALVGGDMYEVLRTPWGPRLLVGDARGKGLDAVRLAARVLGAFRALGTRTADLAELMVLLDSEVAAHRGSDEDFVTAVIAQPDDTDGVALVNAGHPDPLLVAHGRLTALEPQRRHRPLGLGSAPVPYRCSFPAGGRLLLYTDGLLEARHRRTREFLPYEDVVLAALARGTPFDQVAALLAAVDAWSGRLTDDLALLVAARV